MTRIERIDARLRVLRSKILDTVRGSAQREAIQAEIDRLLDERHEIRNRR